MPVAILIIAVVLIAAGIRGSYKQLAALLVGDFTGSGNFLNWLAAIGLVGCVGYVPQLQRFSRMFIALIMVAMFLKQGGGVWDQLVAALNSSSADVQHPNPGNPAAASSGGGDSGFLGAIGGALGIPSNVTSAISSIGSNPLGSLPGATTNPLAQAGGIAGILGKAPAVAAPGSIQANPAGALNGATGTTPDPTTGDPGIIPGL